MNETRRTVTALAAMVLGIVLAGCGASANLRTRAVTCRRPGDVHIQ